MSRTLELGLQPHGSQSSASLVDLGATAWVFEWCSTAVGSRFV
jgi:hypothetical protein